MMTGDAGWVPPGYDLVELLGRGGMGVVYRARQRSLDRDVALKLLQVNAALEPTGARRFERELRLHMELVHPGLTRVIDAGVHGGHLYMAMELVDGCSLARLMTSSGPLPVPPVVRSAHALADALAYLHDRQIVHRDLKPANILVTRSGELRITDFGLAWEASQTWLTAQDAVVGTILYSAPEVVLGERAGPPADLHALGLILYEMLTGPLPYRGMCFPEVIAAITRGSLAAPRSRGRRDVPIRFEGLLMSLLARRADERPTAGEFRLDLEGLMSGLGLEEVKAPLAGLSDCAPGGPGGRREVDGGASTTGISGNRIAIDTTSFDEVAPPRRGRFAPPRRGTVLMGTLGLLLAGLAVPGVRFFRAPGTGLTAASAGRPSTAPLHPGVPEDASEPNAQASRRMRRSIEKVADLNRRFLQSLGSGEVPDSGSTFVTRQVLADSYHRIRKGDPSLLFQALGELHEAIREGDRSSVIGPVWLDLEFIAYRVLIDAGRSSGFDRYSVFLRPLERIREALPAPGGDPYRRCLEKLLLAYMEHGRTMRSDLFPVRVRVVEEVLDFLGRTPDRWRTSPTGRWHRFRYLSEIARLWWMSAAGVVLLLPGESASWDRWRGAQMIVNRMIREELDPGTGLEEPWASFQDQVLVLDAIQSVYLIAERRESAPFVRGLLQRHVPRIDLETAPWGLVLLDRTAVTRFASLVHENPDLGLGEAARRWTAFYDRNPDY